MDASTCFVDYGICSSDGGCGNACADKTCAVDSDGVAAACKADSAIVGTPPSTCANGNQGNPKPCGKNLNKNNINACNRDNCCICQNPSKAKGCLPAAAAVFTSGEDTTVTSPSENWCVETCRRNGRGKCCDGQVCCKGGTCAKSKEECPCVETCRRNGRGKCCDGQVCCRGGTCADSKEQCLAWKGADATAGANAATARSAVKVATAPTPKASAHATRRAGPTEGASAAAAKYAVRGARAPSTNTCARRRASSRKERKMKKRKRMKE